MTNPQTAAEVRAANRAWAQRRMEAMRDNLDQALIDKADRLWAEISQRDLTCGEVNGGRSRVSRHPCARAAYHDFADHLGHVCRCEAERFLERHAPCASARIEDVS